MNASQAELGKQFGRTQSWVSKAQSRPDDPMPKDLDGAIAWGKRNGLLPGEAAIIPGGLPVQPAAAPSVVESADMALKNARRRKLEMEMGLQTGELISREDAEAQQVSIAVEFRKTAGEFALRLRPLIERHVSDAGTVAAIVKDSEALVAELMNRADPHQVLKGMSRDDLRALLIARVEACLE